MTDRDQFAAAALTGFASQPRFNCGSVLTLTAKQCYELADAMLRERERTNLDAAPAARGDARECTAPVTTGGTQWLNYNANDYVRVKLTAHGRELLKKTLPSYTPPTEDADGWSRWQLHRLMNVFGEYMVMGLPLCFETAIRLEAVPPNHDAAPAARANAESVAPQPTAGDRAGNPPSHSGTGDTQSFDAYAMFAGSVMNWISEATSAYASSCSSDGGRKIMADACCQCWDAFDRIAYPTIHGASPEARASVDSVVPQPTPRGDSDRTDKAAPRPSEGTGDTPDSPKPISGCVSDRSKPITGPTHTPTTHATPGEGSEQRECTEPEAWAVCTPGDGDWSPCFFHEPHAQRCANAIFGSKNIVPLYRHPQPTLTDAERDVIEWCRQSCSNARTPQGNRLAATLRGLLERLGGVG